MPAVSRILAPLVSDGAYHAASHQGCVHLCARTLFGVVRECGDVDMSRTLQGFGSSLGKRGCSKGTMAQKHQRRLTAAQTKAHEGLEAEKGLLAWPISTWSSRRSQFWRLSPKEGDHDHPEKP